MNKRHYEHTLPNIRGSLSNTYAQTKEKLYNQSFHNNIFNVQFTIYKVQFNYADASAAKLYFVNGKL